MNVNKRKFSESLSSSPGPSGSNRALKRRSVIYTFDENRSNTVKELKTHNSRDRPTSKSLTRKLLKAAKNRMKAATAKNGLKIDDLLKSLVNFVSLSEVEKEYRHKLFLAIKEAAVKTSLGFREFDEREPGVEIYGSHKYNISFFASDLDIRVTLPGLAKRRYITDSFSEESEGEVDKLQVSRYTAKKYLNFLSSKLRSDAKMPVKNELFGCSIEYRSNSRVPIIFLKTRENVEVDISVKNFAQALDSSKVIDTLRKRYKHFTTLSVLLKIVLIQNDLNKVFHGGLSSFKLYILIAYMFETEKHKYDFETITGCLIAFFETYKNPENFSNEMTINIRLGILIEVEFASVYKLFQVRNLFKSLYGKWKSFGTKHTQSNMWYLSQLINIEKLLKDRSKSCSEKFLDLNDCLLKLQSNCLVPSRLEDMESSKMKTKLVEHLFWLELMSLDT